MIEIKALCACCGPDLYFENPAELRYFADGDWIPCLTLAEVLDLAMDGVALKHGATGHTIRPRAVFLVNGTALCGLCVRKIMGAGMSMNEIVQGLGKAFQQ